MVNRLCSSGILSQDTRQSSFSKRSNIEGEIELGIEPHNFDWLDSEKQREYLRGKFRKKALTMPRHFSWDIGLSSCPGQENKWDRTLTCKPNGERNRTVEHMMLNLADSGAPGVPRDQSFSQRVVEELGLSVFGDSKMYAENIPTLETTMTHFT